MIHFPDEKKKKRKNTNRHGTLDSSHNKRIFFKGIFSLKNQLFFFVPQHFCTNPCGIRYVFRAVPRGEKYQRLRASVTFADGGAGSEEAEAEEVRDYRVKCLNNLAAAQLKLEQFGEALHTSRDVLTLEPNNVKALFRAGKVRALCAGFLGEVLRVALIQMQESFLLTTPTGHLSFHRIYNH